MSTLSVRKTSRLHRLLISTLYAFLVFLCLVLFALLLAPEAAAADDGVQETAVAVQTVGATLWLYSGAGLLVMALGFSALIGRLLKRRARFE